MRWSQRAGEWWGRLGRGLVLLWLVGGLTPLALAAPVEVTPIETEAPVADPAADSQAWAADSDAGLDPGLSASESDSKTRLNEHTQVGTDRPVGGGALCTRIVSDTVSSESVENNT